MKAYLFSIGEQTTDICASLLKRYGFDAVLLDGEESILDKYKRFIKMADEDCLKIDADIIPNEDIKLIKYHSKTASRHSASVINYSCYDFYHNGIWVGCPTYYSKGAIEAIKRNLDTLDASRPETSACRLPEIHPNIVKSDLVVGMHGFFQAKQDTIRCIEQKKARGQSDQFDFNLINKLKDL